MLGTNVSTVTIMLLLMVIGVIFTQVMSNIALSAILIPLAVTLAAAQGQPIGIYAVPVAICMFAFVHVPNGRSNSCNGIWNGLCEYKRNTQSRNSNGCNWNYTNSSRNVDHSQTIPWINKKSRSFQLFKLIKLL